MRIHFIGIGGSGISGISILAKQSGHTVSGCDLEESTPYIDKVKESGINVLKGHSNEHVHDMDLVVVSPALLFVNENHPEVSVARKLGKLITWEEFLGKFLHEGKEVFCISGTHGKSTTTAMLGKIFEDAKLDPLVTVGATVNEWKANYRVGSGKIFISEADEFNDNFLYYNPSTIILNNVEMDHADYFKDEVQVFRSFSNFIQKLVKKKILIVNQDSPGILKALQLVPKKFLDQINIYGYTMTDTPLVKLDNSIRINIQKADDQGTKFSLASTSSIFKGVYQLRIPGEFNVANATGVIILSRLNQVADNVISKALKKFNGVGRRLEFLGERNGIKVYDDYAHHPTAIRATLSALRQMYPKKIIWAINEPHSYSRTRELLKEYNGVFGEANKIIIAPIFKARDKETFGVTNEKLSKATGHKDAVSLNSFQEIVKFVSDKAARDEIILVMGAGKSYLLAREILSNL